MANLRCRIVRIIERDLEHQPHRISYLTLHRQIATANHVLAHQQQERVALFTICLCHLSQHETSDPVDIVIQEDRQNLAGRRDGLLSLFIVLVLSESPLDGEQDRSINQVAEESEASGELNVLAHSAKLLEQKHDGSPVDVEVRLGLGITVGRRKNLQWWPIHIHRLV